MKKIIEIAALVLLGALLMSCGGSKEEKPITVEGSWELSNYATKAVNFGSESVSVYIVFEQSDFTLYQQLGAGAYRIYTGTYSILDGKLSGSYSNGSHLSAVYDVQTDGSTMTLSTEKESYTYRSATVPDSVISSAY